MPPKPKPITVVKNFGGRRNTGTPLAVQEWSLWDCDPEDTSGRTPSRGHAYGRTFPWVFDVLEKAYVLEGEATLTPEDPARHGPATRIGPGDMVTFPRGWRGTWEVHSFLRKHYAFFDARGLRVDEASDDDDDDDDAGADPGTKVQEKDPPLGKKPAAEAAAAKTAAAAAGRRPQTQNKSAGKRKDEGTAPVDTKPVAKRGKKG